MTPATLNFTVTPRLQELAPNLAGSSAHARSKYTDLNHNQPDTSATLRSAPQPNARLLIPAGVDVNMQMSVR